MRAVLAMAVALLFAGCLSQPSEGLGRMRGDAGPPEPYFWEYRDRVETSHLKTYPVPVGARASALQVHVQLTAAGGDMLGQVPAFALLDVRLLAPDGSEVLTRQVDPQHPHVSLALTEFVQRGEYVLEIAGRGASAALATGDAGAFYDLTIEVVHA